MPRFELRGKVNLDGSKWEAGLKQAKRSADKWSSETSGMIRRRLIQAFAVGTMWQTASAAMDRAKTISRDASRLDISPEMFQHLEYAAERSKVEIDDVRESILELSVKQQEVAKGSKDVTEAFQRFGLEFDDVINEKPLTLFKKIADSIASGQNNQNMIADLDTILSDDGKKLISAMKENFFRSVEESIKIGAPFTGKDIDSLLAGRDFLSESEQKIGVGIGKGANFLQKWFPVWEVGMRDIIKDFNDSMKNFGQQNPFLIFPKEAIKSLQKIEKNTNVLN